MKRPEFGFFKSFVVMSEASTTRPGSWSLQPIKVISLYPKEDSLLTIKQGKVWATLNTDSEDRATGYGDHFLSASESLLVRKGQHLVFESVMRDTPVFFDFVPL